MMAADLQSLPMAFSRRSASTGFRARRFDWPGLKHANIVKTGERTYCIIAEWTDTDSLAKARPNMIATLDSFRDTLEDLGGSLGVTDPVSGPVVLALK